MSAIVATFLFAAPAWAQNTDPITGQEIPQVERDPMYNAPYDWYVSFGVGGVSGANPVGSTVDEDTDENLTFGLGDGFFVSGRGGKRLWWRLGGEVEFGYGSPGVELTTSSPDGTNIMTTDFSDYSFGMLAFSARLDLTDSRITPFLVGGLAIVFASIETDSGSESDTNPGFIFGGGLDVRVRDNINFRGDVRGLRAGVNAPALSRGILVPRIEESDALSTMWLYSFGVSVRFD